MRAFFRSLVLGAFLLHSVSPLPVAAQTYDQQGQQILRQNTNDRDTRPGLEDFLLPLGQLIIQQNQQQRRQPDTGGSTAPSQTEERPPSGTQNTDRDGPVIRLTEQQISSQSRSARLSARITDRSGVRRAIVAGGRQVTMSRSGGQVFVADIPLSADYKPVSLVVQAWDRFGNTSRSAPVTMRRLPACGSARGISVPLVQTVQRLLTSLNRYQGAIDGLAGPNTCRAVAEEGYGGQFSWEILARELDARVARGLIGLEVDATGAVTAQNRLAVRVIDPRNTGDVFWIRMLVDGVTRDMSEPQGGAAYFTLPLAEGRSKRVEFHALDRRQAVILARTGLTLTRPAALKLSLTSDQLSGDRIESEDKSVTLLASIEGASTGRIYYENGAAFERRFEPYEGRPAELQIAMPAPGETAALWVWARSGDRNVQRRQIELRRLRVIAPDVPVLLPELGPTPQANRIPDLPEETRPLPRVFPAAFEQPLPDALTQEIDTAVPQPPANDLVPLVVAISTGIILLAGMAGGWRPLLRMIGRDRPVQTKAAAAKLRIVAVADPSPAIETTAADFPALVLTVDPATESQTVLEFDDELEALAS